MNSTTQQLQLTGLLSTLIIATNSDSFTYKRRLCMVNPIKVVKGLLEVEEALAEFISNGPSDGLPGYVRDRYRDRCDEFANLPSWARALSGITGGSISRFCKPYWDSGGFDGPVLSGGGPINGRCPVQYFFTWSTGGFAESNQTNSSVVGPMSQPVRTPGFNARWTATNGAGETLVFGRDSNVAPAEFEGWLRVDGQPDECESEPPELQPGPNPPPNPGPLPGPEPIDNPDPDNPIPFFPIPPFEDPVFGPQPITGFDDSPAPPPPTLPQPSGDNQPGEPDSVGNPIGDGVLGDTGEDIDFGEPPLGKIWVGCLVEFSVSNAYGNIPNTGPENTVYPLTVGNVSLRYGNLRGTSLQVRSRFTELFRPNTALEVTGAFVQTRPNTMAIVRPISVTVCKSQQCLED